MKLLLLSSSRVDDTGYLEHASSYIKQLLGESISEVLFIPYAGISIGFDAYQEKTSQAFTKLGYKMCSIHQFEDQKKAIETAEAIAVGGGNTFCLLNSLYQLELMELIKAKVKQGIPYIGWSAGSNIAAPTIRTTNDMPIIKPSSFAALNLLPFQINPHYIDGNPPGHHGETREMRIHEFLMVNPQQRVIGIPEGTALKLENNKLEYLGNKTGYQFTSKHGKQTIEPQTDLSHWL